MLTIRRAGERGYADHGWLKSRHTFSFADYYDPAHMGFRGLRVINEDRVEGGMGFGTHPHRDMEIVSYVLEGALEHRDSMKNGSVITPGDVQRMSAGTGVTHSEFNASKTDEVHFLQIWIVPDRRGIQPSYEQKLGRLRLVASPDGADGSVKLHADARIHAGVLDAGQSLGVALDQARHTWVQVARGRVRLNGRELEAGDGASLSGEARLDLEGLDACEVIVFDLA